MAGLVGLLLFVGVIGVILFLMPKKIGVVLLAVFSFLPLFTAFDILLSCFVFNSCLKNAGLGVIVLGPIIIILTLLLLVIGFFFLFVLIVKERKFLHKKLRKVRQLIRL